MHRSTKDVTLDQLFDNLRAVHEARGRLPRQQDLKDRQLSRYGDAPYRKRFKNWNKAIETYRRWRVAREHTETAQKPLLTPPPQRIKPPQKREALSHAHNDTYGPPIDFRGMRYAPTNRDGVLFLFSKVHETLGILVEHLRTGRYPDCEAKRRAPKTKGYKRCNIEFEVNSSRFRTHVSKGEFCDLIVCWEHDWEDCPIEVLSLKDAIA
jgi:hypothetical protein